MQRSTDDRSVRAAYAAEQRARESLKRGIGDPETLQQKQRERDEQRDAGTADLFGAARATALRQRLQRSRVTANGAENPELTTLSEPPLKIPRTETAATAQTTVAEPPTKRSRQGETPPFESHDTVLITTPQQGSSSSAAASSSPTMVPARDTSLPATTPSHHVADAIPAMLPQVLQVPGVDDKPRPFFEFSTFLLYQRLSHGSVWPHGFPSTVVAYLPQ